MKFVFRIRTRAGVHVDKLTILGRDEGEARTRLRQMYRDCEVVECVCHQDGMRIPLAGPSRIPAMIAKNSTAPV